MPDFRRSPESGEHDAFAPSLPIFSTVSNIDSTVAGRLAVAALLPGIPFLIARVLLHKHSGLFNLDYVLLTVLACAWSVRLASVLFVLTYLLETARVLDTIYFFTQQDVAYAAHFLGSVPSSLVAAWAFAFVALTAISLLVWRMLLPRARGARLWRAATPLVGVFLVCGTLDLSQGFNPALQMVHAMPRHHLVGEVLVRMPLEVMHGASRPERPTVIQESATGLLWSNGLVRQRHENVAVIVVESMGLLEDEAGRDKELSPLLDDTIRQHYVVSEGTAPFTGGTVTGEMRELCHLKTGAQITDMTLAGQAPCLPSQFRSMGYQTVAYHGFRGGMFQRQDWYPKVGFGETVFLGKLRPVSMCNGTFYGACDADVASRLEARLAQKTASGAAPQFLYWMTLNSHLPVDVGRAPSRDCPVRADAESCAQLSYVQEVLKAVRRLALDPKIGPTTIVVVGDHAPPYISTARRYLFDEARVPFITLQPRG